MRRGEHGDGVAHPPAHPPVHPPVHPAPSPADSRALPELGSAEDRFRAVFHHAGVGVAVVGLDGRIVDSNTALARMLGTDAVQLRGRPIEDITHPDDVAAERAMIRQLLAGVRDSYELDKRYIRPDGRAFWARLTASIARDDEGTPLFAVGMVHDITAQRLAEERLRRSEQRYRDIVETAGEGIWIVDPEWRTVFANQRMAALLGVALDEVYRRPAHEFLADEEQLADARRTMQARQAGTASVVERRFRRADGTLLHALSSGRPLRHPDGRFAGTLAMITDITERKRAELQLAFGAWHDPLTELPNRALLLDRVSQALRRGKRGEQAALLYCDLDDFKLINDTMGHHEGDRVLREIARRFGSLVRPGDTVARLGGDEFAVLCTDVADATTALLLADRLRSAFDDPVPMQTGFVRVEGAIGVAMTPVEDAETLLRNADAAMYRAKSRRAPVALYDETLHADALRRLHVVTHLSDALPAHQLSVFYQPIVAVGSGETRGAEALLRWTHPELGQVPPAEFIPLAETSGAILRIGRWVMEQACRDAAEFRSGAPGFVRVSINLSARQLADPALVRTVATVLDETATAPEQLLLEITETALMADAADALATLRRLKDLGVALAIDDFGTGYSSLSYLKRFPVDRLKIDRQFVAGVTSQPEDRAIVEAVLAMANALDLTTVAEGVETPGQLDVLQALGCPLAQGYLWSPAIDADALTRLLADADGPVRRHTARSSPPGSHRADSPPVDSPPVDSRAVGTPISWR